MPGASYRPRPPRPVARTRDWRDTGSAFGLRRRFGLVSGSSGSSAGFFLRAMAYAAAIRTAAVWRSTPQAAFNSMRMFDWFVVPLDTSKRARLTGLRYIRP